MFFWPAFSGWCGIAVGIWGAKARHRSFPPIAFAVSALAGLALWCPMLYLMFLAIPEIFGGLVVMTVFVYGLLLCCLDGLLTPRHAV